jgi:formylglycine-generating enzyme required for sulfatase activity
MLASPSVNLEISFFPTGASAYTVDLRLSISGRGAETQFSPGSLQIDHTALLAYLPDIRAYGICLSAQLFAAESLRIPLIKARALAEGMGLPLRITLRLDPRDELLQSIYWETLCDPEEAGFLAVDERLRLTRALPLGNLAASQRDGGASRKALLVVASPSDLASFGLAEIAVEQQVALAEQALGRTFDVIVVARGRTSASMFHAIGDALRQRPNLFYLVCHGTQSSDGGYLWLEDERGLSQRVRADQLGELIGRLTHRPSLAVLNTCYGGGLGAGGGLHAGIGAHLALAGVQAVIAMQGPISVETVTRFMPVFFSELCRDGEVDRAVAAARGAVLDRPDWWMNVLFLRSPGTLLPEIVASPAAEQPGAMGGGGADLDELLWRAHREWDARWPVDSIGALPLFRLIATLGAARDHRMRPPGQTLALLQSAVPVFEDLPDHMVDLADRLLLVLGPPRSGKTSLLIKFGHALLARATQDPARPIPVLLDLSEWTGRLQSLEEWIHEELECWFERSHATVRAPLDWARLVLLLDGLGQIDARHRPSALDVLHDLLHRFPCRLVISLSPADFLVQTTPLHAGSMVLLAGGSDRADGAAANGDSTLAAELVALLATHRPLGSPDGTEGSRDALTPAGVRAQAVMWLEREDAPRSLRIEIARVLGKLGDPRFPVTLADWEREVGDLGTVVDGRPPYWCGIGPGTYEVGGATDATGCARVSLRQFWIARYPITVAQYRIFLESSYQPAAAHLWPPHGWQWRLQSKGEDPRNWGKPGYDLDNQPVVGITWYEAMAFARWLTVQCQYVLPAGYTLRLPTEAEWEVAATTDGQGARCQYPWGSDVPTPEHVFFDDHECLLYPPSVGCLRLGQAANGAMDLGGTVWEVTASSYRDYPAQSHVRLEDCPPHLHNIAWRGVSWRWQGEHFDISQRKRSSPSLTDRDLGFRLALAPT